MQVFVGDTQRVIPHFFNTSLSGVLRRGVNMKTQSFFVFEFYTSFFPETKYMAKVQDYEPMLYKNYIDERTTYSRHIKGANGTFSDDIVSSEEFSLAFDEALGFNTYIIIKSLQLPLSFEIYNDGLVKIIVNDYVSQEIQNKFDFCGAKEVTNDFSFESKELLMNRYSYLRVRYSIHAALNILNRTELTLWGTSFGLNDESSDIGRNIEPVKIVCYFDTYNDVFISKAKKNGQPAATEMKIVGNFKHPLYLFQSEIKALEFYEKLKSEAKIQIDEKISALQKFKHSF